MSVKKLKQKVAVALIIAMSATNVLSAAAAPVGSPSKEAAVKVTFLGGEGGTWNKEIASKSTASKSSAFVATGSNAGSINKIERTYIVERGKDSQYMDDEGNSFINLEWSAEFENGNDWGKVQQEGFDFTGWYSEDNTYITDKTQIYNNAKLTAKWQSSDVKAPIHESNIIEESIVSGLEAGQQFILKDIANDTETDAECLTRLEETLGREALQLISSQDEIVKLEINVEGYKKGQEVTITFPVPKELNIKEGDGLGKDYDISAFHFKGDGRTEILPVTFDDGLHYMTFVVKNGFSPFYLAKTAPQDPNALKDVKVTIKNVEHGYITAWTDTAEGRKYLPIGEEVTIPAEDQPLYVHALGYGPWMKESISVVPKAEGSKPIEWKNGYMITEDSEIVATFKEDKGEYESGHREFSFVLEPYSVTEENLDYTGKVVKLRRYNEETGKRETVPEDKWSLRPADKEELMAKGFERYAYWLDQFDFDPETNTLTSKAPLKMGYYSYPVVITYEGADGKTDDYAYITNSGSPTPYCLQIQVGANVTYYHGFIKTGDTYSSNGSLGWKRVSYKDELTWDIAQPAEEDLYDGEPQMYGYTFKGWQSRDGKPFTSDDQKLVSDYEDEEYYSVYDLFEKEDGTVYAPELLGLDDDEDEPSKPTNPSKPGSSGGSGSGSSGGSSSAAKDYTMHGKWIANGDGWKFLKDSGEYAVNTWGFINGKWYYFDAQGNMVTGWYQVNGQWYFMTPEKGANEGVMVTGWRLDTTYNAWFYLGAGGAMVTGWQQINGVWYYLNPVSDGTKGAMASNTYVDGYFVNADGAWVQ